MADNETSATSLATNETTVQGTNVATTVAQTQVQKKNVNQLLSVVGWALADASPSGFHSKYMGIKDMAALTESAMTLANQNKLGIELNLEKTDDPKQIMLSDTAVNELLPLLVAGGKLEASTSIGSLSRLGSGWAITPPDETVSLPVTSIVDEEDTPSGKLLTIVLVQPTATGETVLQTAMVEVNNITGGFGYTVESWVTQDVPRFSTEYKSDHVELSSSVMQAVSAVEITWVKDGPAQGATLTVGMQQVNIKGSDMKAGTTQVIILSSPQDVEGLTLTISDPTAASKILPY
jgi:hypothetical protein